MTSAPTEESIRDLKLKSSLNLVAFRHCLLRCEEDVMPAEFHYAWSDELLKGELSQVIEAYRESGKTQYILRAFLLYALVFPSKKFDYIVLIKNNATLACAKLKEIEEEYLSNPILRANLVQIKQQSSEVFSVDVRTDDGTVMNVRIEAYGKGASIRGLVVQDTRPRIAIIDDPQDLEDSKSEITLESDWQWFLSDVKLLGSKTRIFLIGNNLGDKCIVERVIAAKDALGYKTSRIPVEIGGVPTWPAKNTIQQIMDEKRGYQIIGQLDIWNREKMCMSVTKENQVFDTTKFLRYPYKQTKEMVRNMRLFATLDPASSTEPGSCYRAIVVNAVDQTNKWFVVDIRYGRWDSIELINQIFDVVTTWKLQPFGIEKGMLKQVLEPFIRQKMIKDQVFFDLIPIEHAKRGTKLERIKMLAPRVDSQSVYLPDAVPNFEKDGVVYNWLVELLSELLGVTRTEIKSLFIDLVDALAMQDQIAEAPLDVPGSVSIDTRKMMAGGAGGW